MEKLMNNQDYLKEITAYFRENKYVKECLLIKEQMKENQDIQNKINRIKTLQKKFVNSNFSDMDIKLQLDNLESDLLLIPIYCEYMRNLEEINKQIEYFKEEMNNYFDEIIHFNLR